MDIIYTHNPLDFACPNHTCSADEGQPCRTVGGFLSATPHTPRLRLAVDGVTRGAHVDGGEREAWRAGADRYLRDVMRELLGRPATDTELAHAARDGSLKPDRGWLRDAINFTSPAPVHHQPTRRQLANGDLTLWGRVLQEVELPAGGFLLKLHTGESVYLPSEFWRTVWPERKAIRVELERDHPEIRQGWWRFGISHGKCTAADEEQDRDEPAPAVRLPAAMIGQTALF